MAIVKVPGGSEPGPLRDSIAEYGEALEAAGVRLASERPRPGDDRARVVFDRDGSRTILAGDAAGPASPIDAFWVLHAGSLAEAVDLAARLPLPPGAAGEVEVRLVGCNGHPEPPPDEPGWGRVTKALDTERKGAMRFMVMVRATKESESEASPVADEKIFREMGAFNEELVKAGVMLAGEGLQPSSKGARVHFSPDGSRTVVDGPFAETKELIAGFWLWQVKSLEECIEWVKRCPAPFATECEIEIRRVYEAEDFGDAMTPDLREQEDRLRAQIAEQQAKA